MRISRKDGSRTLIARYDLADADLIQRYTWHLSMERATAYPVTTATIRGERLYIFMAQLLMGPGGRIAHLNGDGMDNRRCNLAFQSQSQILAKRRPAGGKSRFKGVAWDAQQGKWVARFRGKNLGRFDIEEDAARAFDDAAFEYWGHQAYFNFPDEVADWVWTPPAPAEDEVP